MSGAWDAETSMLKTFFCAEIKENVYFQQDKGYNENALHVSKALEVLCKPLVKMGLGE